MKIKLAIILGILTWITSNILIRIFNPILHSTLQNIEIISPLISIIVIGFFGIIYIRNIEKNEVVEGFLAGVIFVIIDIILDNLIFILTNKQNLIVSSYPLHLFAITTITLLITTFIGYLAQMKVDLK